MPVDKLLIEMNARMDKTIQVFHDELSTIRTGKASPALVENIQVDYYGTPTRLREMAKIATPEPRLIVIQPWDPSVVPAIVKAINQSSLGITPVNDGKLVRLPIPELDEERRKDLVKTVRKIAEDTRVSIRNVRREQNEELKKLQKAGTITEDDLHREEKRVQEATDGHIRKIDELLAGKEKEIMEV
ncbi:MAG: ribosome recycling factor [Verrucomicrobia bacterium]|nr:ribosome recycling factor [Verrucomicrobiota bacterium]